MNADIIIEELVNVVSSKHLLYERKGLFLLNTLSFKKKWFKVYFYFKIDFHCELVFVMIGVELN